MLHVAGMWQVLVLMVFITVVRMTTSSDDNDDDDVSFSTNVMSSRNDSRGVYICITGQLSRLELTNKIYKLIKPLHERLGYDIYIGLALATNTSHFTNVNNGDKMRLTYSLSKATKRLLNIDGVKEVRHFLPQHSKKIYVNKWYKLQLDNDKTIRRVRNHARQYKTLQLCSDWHNISQFAQIAVRVRDDVLFERIDVNEAVRETLKSGDIVTARCDAWGGINDKVAFIPSSLYRDFFLLPYEKYLKFNAHLPQLNPEKYYQYAYSTSRIKMTSLNSLYVAKAVTRIKPGQHFSKGSVSLNDDDSRICHVTSNPHKSFSPGCDEAFASGSGVPTPSLHNPGTYLSSSEFGVAYETECWL